MFTPSRFQRENGRRPTAPTYTWYINGTDAETIDEVVIEFDVLDTVEPLDGIYFAYDQAYYLVLHNFTTIPALPPWPRENIELSQTRGNVDMKAMIELPELGVDLKKYAVRDGEHVRIAVPYSEFRNASKDLTLQFLPGTTFGNLSAYLFGANGLHEDSIDRISQKMEYPDRSSLQEELAIDFREKYGIRLDQIGAYNREAIENINYSQGILAEAYVINEDGSVNMPASFYDLGEYASQVKGAYTVAPEGLVSVFAILQKPNYFSDEQRRKRYRFRISKPDG